MSKPTNKLGWALHCKHSNPLTDILSFIHGSAADEHGRILNVAVLVLALWQAAGRAMTARVPSFLLVHGDAVADALDPLDEFAKRQTGMGSTEPGGPGQGTCVGSNENLALKMMTRVVRERQQINNHPEILSYKLPPLVAQWRDAKPLRFGSGRAGQYARMFEADLGWVTDYSDDIILRLDSPIDHAKFRCDVLIDPELLLEPKGYGADLTLVNKCLTVAGSLRPEQWDQMLVDGIVNLGLPTFFLPHVGHRDLVFQNQLSFEMIAIGFASIWPEKVGLQIVPPTYLPESTQVATCERVLRSRLHHNFPGSYEYAVLQATRELPQVCARITGFIIVSSAATDQGIELYRDLHALTYRAITIGVASLAYHGYGFDAGCSFATLKKLLKILRNSESLTRRELLRKLPELNASQRDQVLARLAAEGLVTCDGPQVAAVALAEFISGLPAQLGLGEPELETTALPETTEGRTFADLTSAIRSELAVQASNWSPDSFLAAISEMDRNNQQPSLTSGLLNGAY